MSLKFAILGFLDIAPLSGYDLKKMFDSSVKYFWTATHSQIYKTLNDINSEGLVDVKVINQINLPNKKLYYITEKGKQELLNWIQEPTELPPTRHKLLVQLSWADRLSNDKIIKIIENYVNRLEERLAIYKNKNQQQFISLARSPREKYLWQSTLENGINEYESERKWALDTIEGLKRFDVD